MSSPLQPSPPPSPRFYRAFGRTLESFVDLPGRPLDQAAAPDWRYRLEAVVADGAGERDDDAVVPVPDADGDRYEARGFGRFIVRGHDIDVHPRPNIRLVDLVVPITGSFSAVLLGRAGHLVLHGTALQHGEGCYVLCGNAGAGKSTQAAYLVQQGWSLVADDVSAIAWEGDRPVVLRGFNGLRLFPASLELLGRNPSDFPPLHPGTTKRQVLAQTLSSRPVSAADVTDTVPLRAIVLLDAAEESQFGEMPKRQALVTLMNFQHPAAAGVANQTEATRQKVFTEAARLAQSTRVLQLARPLRRGSLAEVHRLLAE